MDNEDLCYHWLGDFDREMLKVIKSQKNFQKTPVQEIWHNDGDQILAFSRGDLLFVFNFHNSYSETQFFLHAHTVGEGQYRVVLSTDEERFGGQALIDHSVVYETEYTEGKGLGFNVYSPCRTAMVLERIGG